ncbi:UNKNOWN [Stylonychia lemnae]|uniref:Uncharacterized protein n=1 Tax=Stylonychia lemnae TaxID=5949 RepID=A0A078B880_STYLE|nr:UNKNOWN [Stylonychia lemnae]|eukprot:CDW90614.1 UNKNOWN [Stylonychia lemnae]
MFSTVLALVKPYLSIFVINMTLILFKFSTKSLMKVIFHNYYKVLKQETESLVIVQQDYFQKQRLAMIDIKNEKFIEFERFKELNHNACNLLVYRGWAFIQQNNKNREISMFNLLTQDLKMLAGLNYFQQSVSRLMINGQGKLQIVVQAFERLRRGDEHSTNIFTSIKRISDITPVEGLYSYEDHFNLERDTNDYVGCQGYHTFCIDQQNGIYLYLATKSNEICLQGQILRTNKLNQNEQKWTSTTITQIETLDAIKKYILILFEGQAFEQNQILISGKGLFQFQ